jgi:hypothetical protein
VSARTRNLDPPLDLRGYTGIKLRVRGDGNRYKFILRDSDIWDGPSWSTTFDTADGEARRRLAEGFGRLTDAFVRVCVWSGEWMDVKIPFSELVPVMRTMSIPPSQRVPFAGDRRRRVRP